MMIGECIDDFFLSRPESLESEPLIQNLCRENRYLPGLKNLISRDKYA